MSGEAQSVAPPADAFRFGQNWQRFLETQLNPERVQIAADSLATLLETNLEGKTFLDIGCGSGLFSFCAFNAGAAQVISVDVDPDSVAATQSLHKQAGEPANWRVLHGSILDTALLEQLQPAEVVYSWGVLHHTGDMWPAIRNASKLVADGGIFAIAIYNRVTQGLQKSERWLRIKRTYNHSPRPVQVAMEAAYAAATWASQILKGRNPVRIHREYKKSRGMALMTDMRDWIGGYPYEYATVDEIVRFCEDELGFKKRKVVPVGPDDLGNNEFVFDKPASGA